MSPNLPSFPEHWQDRLIALDLGDVRVFFVEPNDVGVSKYIRGDERDLRWLRAGLQSSLLNIDTMMSRIGSAPVLNADELKAARKRLESHRKRLKL